jgi:hypothetical protein
MAIRAKIDSNETGLAFAEEVIGTPGVLPVTPEWWPAEPNEYDDFGGELTLLARRPINPSRQRKKGSITDLDASGGFNQDLTNTNTQRLLQGFMYASLREKPNAIGEEVTATGVVVADETIFAAGMLVLASGFNNSGNNGLKVVTSVDAGSSEVRFAGTVVEGSPPADAKLVVVGYQAAAGTLDVVVTGNFATITSTGGVDFTTLGLIAGEFVYVGGDSAGLAFATAANNGFKRIHSVAAGALVIDKSVLPMQAESSTTETVQLFFGRVLKNELGSLIVRRSYNVERQLGAPDTSNPSQFQAEYLVGAFGNEMTVNIEQADKINIDFSFVALDNEQRTATQGLKAGDRMTIDEADAYNTSTDFNTMRLAIFNGADEAPDPLFAHLLELAITVNNNVSVNKAVAVLGGFDVTLGVFEVSAEMTAYFSTVEAVQAVRKNRDVTLHACVAKNQSGFAIDLPLAALGDARLEVEIDEPITLPLMMDAATAVKLNPDTDYTLMWCFFDYLPLVAEA